MLPTRVARTNGSDPVESFHREFDTAISRLFGGGDGGQIRWTPFGVDVREDADHIYVEAELPGFRKDDVDITLENQTLTITAERSESSGSGNGNGNGGNGGQPGAVEHAGRQQQQPQQQQGRPQGDWLLRERRYSRFQRSFTLPPTVDESTVHAKL